MSSPRKPPGPAMKTPSVAAPVPDGGLSGRELCKWSVGFGLIYVLLHIPFLSRYDLFLSSGNAQCYLMMKRILSGELYIYQWAGDYTGMGPVDFVTALLFAIFKPSLALCTFVNLLFWGLGISLLVASVGLCLGKRAAIGSGCALAIGMPYFLKFTIVPYGSGYNLTAAYVGLFVWLTILLLRRGPQSWLCVLTALIMGWYWYALKNVLVVWLAIGAAMMALTQGRDFLKRFVRSKMLVFSAVAFLIGYSPEIIYKIGFIASAAERTKDSTTFLGIASPDLMVRNWYMTLRCIPAYFDADPWARSPEGVHYLNHMENWESFPLNPVDMIGILAAFVVISFCLRMAIRNYHEKNIEVFILAICPFVTFFTVLIAARSGGGYYGIRRYIMPAGVVLLAWLGVYLAQAMKAWNWGVSVLLAATLVASAFHQVGMHGLPDELVDYRTTLEDIEANGYKYGMSWYSFSHLLTTLSDEKVMFGIIDRTFQSPYQKPATEAETVAIVWPAVNPPPFEFAQTLFFGGVKFKDDAVRNPPETISILGHEYRRIGEPKIHGELGWAPYRKVI